MNQPNTSAVTKQHLTIRADFSQREVITPDQYQWVESPIKGVQRMMLDRIGNEVARATSLVRYAPNSRFPNHVHGGGEEILVLEGVFGDEQGQYPAGSYLRNPPGSSHTPEVGSEGATIFVKLHQFEPQDQRQFSIQTYTGSWYPGLVDGLSVLPLHEFEGEHVALVKWAPFTRFNPHQHWGGEEIFVLEGTFFDEYGSYPGGTWLRNPHLSRHTPFTKSEGALIYVKTGHLSNDTGA